MVDDSWYKLVVKILKWEDNGQYQTESLDKISNKEWQQYCANLKKNNSSYSEEIITQKIEETKRKIKTNGGFA